MQLLLFLGIAFGGFIIISFIGVFVLAKITGISIALLQDSKNWNMANPAILTFMRGMILVQFLFLFTIPVLLFGYFSDPKPMRYLGLKAPNNTLFWILSIGLMIVAYPFTEYLGYLNQKIPIGGQTAAWMKGMEEEASRQIGAMLSKHTPVELIKNLIFISLFAGIGEELFFRGILQRLFIRVTKTPWMGIVLTAAIFSGIHFQFYGFFPRMFLGILLGAIYWYSGSLWIAMLCHFLYDATVIVLVYNNPQMLTEPDAPLIRGQDLQLLTMALISLGFTIFILRQMEKKSVAGFASVYNDDFPPKDDFSF